MRFKKYILLSLVLCGLAACSDDNTIEIPEAPVLEKAQLALAIKSEKGVTTKATEVSADAKVNDLTVGVFGTGWSVVYSSSVTDEGTQEIGPKEVYAGAAKVVVVANASDAVKRELVKATSVSDFIATTIDLGEEYSAEGVIAAKGFTMSSEVLDVEIKTDLVNFIGYADEKGASISIQIGGTAYLGEEVYGSGPVRLVRDVASIALASVTTANPENANYQSKSFSLKEVFIASAKGVSSVASSSYWGSIEKTFGFTNGGFEYTDYKVGQILR